MSQNITDITIITVCYNAKDQIQATIESVLNQNYPSIEYIIIDGASSDGTVDCVKQYGKKISKFISEKDNGIFDAMNKGIGIANGEWILFLNAGDILYSPNVISDIFKDKTYKSEILFGDTLNRYRWGYVLWEGKPFKGVEPRLPFCHQSVFVRRDLLLNNKFDTSYRFGADHKQLYTLYLKGHLFEHISSIVSVFDTTGVSSYNIQGYKEVCRANNYGKAKSFFKSFLFLVKVYLYKITPKFIIDKYRYYKYKKKGLIYHLHQEH